MSSGRFCKNNVVLGGRYSSGICGAAAGAVDLSPPPAFFAVAFGASAACEAAPAPAVGRRWDSIAARACLRSVLY